MYWFFLSSVRCLTTSGMERTTRTRKWKRTRRTVVSTTATVADRRQFSGARTGTPDKRQTTESRTDGRIRWTRCTAATRNTPDTRRSWSVRRSRCTRPRTCPNSCVPVTRAVGPKWCSRCSSCTNIVSPVNECGVTCHFSCQSHIILLVTIYLFICFNWFHIGRYMISCEYRTRRKDSSGDAKPIRRQKPHQTYNTTTIFLLYLLKNKMLKCSIHSKCHLLN